VAARLYGCVMVFKKIMLSLVRREGQKNASRYAPDARATFSTMGLTTNLISSMSVPFIPSSSNEQIVMRHEHQCQGGGSRGRRRSSAASSTREEVAIGSSATTPPLPFLPAPPLTAAIRAVGGGASPRAPRPAGVELPQWRIGDC
jgi:hypothetical protein